MQGGEFVVEDGFAGRGPEAEEEASLGADCGGDGFDRVVGGVSLLFYVLVFCFFFVFIHLVSFYYAYDHGIETSTVKGAIGTVETLRRLKFGLEVGLGLDLAGCESVAVVEALDGSGGCRDDGR